MSVLQLVLIDSYITADILEFWQGGLNHENRTHDDSRRSRGAGSYWKGFLTIREVPPTEYPQRPLRSDWFSEAHCSRLEYAAWHSLADVPDKKRRTTRVIYKESLLYLFNNRPFATANTWASRGVAGARLAIKKGIVLSNRNSLFLRFEEDLHADIIRP